MQQINKASVLVAAFIVVIDISSGSFSTERSNQLHLVYANPPMWHLNYKDRLLVMSDTLNYIRNKHKTDIYQTNLSGASKFPWTDLPSDIIIIQMQCSDKYDNLELMKQIGEGYFGRYYRFLQYLRVTNCFLENLTSKTFQRLTRLSSLIIESKHLKYLPPNVFSNLPNIILIKINFGNLTTISSNLFCNNPRIVFVNFSFNNLQAITSGELGNETCHAGTINSLVFSGNKFEKLMEVNFERFLLNGILSLSHNSIRFISNASFSGLSNVRTIDLSYNKIEYIQENSFLSLTETLQYINVMSNNISNINASALFSGPFLKVVILHTNRIDTISGTFSNLKNLGILELKNNRLTSVPRETFYGLASLTILTLDNNKIEFVDKGVFDQYKNLEQLSISVNQISELPKDIFKFTTSLWSLKMKYNSIKTLDEGIFENCLKLNHLNVKSNQLSGIKRLTFTPGHISYIELSNNKLSALPTFTKPNCTDCYNFLTLKEIKFYYNSITYVNASCFQTLQILGVSYNEINSMDGFGAMSKLTKLRIRHNKISTIPVREMSKLCQNLIQLDIGENMIQNIAKRTFSNCKHLEILKLDKNLIQTFNPVTFSAFSELYLSMNPLECDCQNEDFFNWIEYNKKVSLDDMRCSTGKLIKEVKISECYSSASFKSLAKQIGIPLSVLLVLSLAVAGFVFRFRHEIQIIAFYKWNIRLSCCCMKKQDVNTDFKYDAFVCFAEENINYVTDCLIPFLEPKYRLCVYYRDFPLGEDIAEAILDVINQSAVIIILLSQDFVKSRWGAFEFRNAHHAAITNKDKRLIIIVLDDSVLNSKLDLTLKSIIYTKAYLKKNDKLFEEKLLHAMPVEPVGNAQDKAGEGKITEYTYQTIYFETSVTGSKYDAFDDIDDHYDVI